jgi:YfiH family protein
MSGFRVEDLSKDLFFKSEPYLIYWNKKNNGNSNYLLSSAKKMNLENNLAYSSQIHSNSIAIVESPGMIGEYDSLITKKYGILLGIQVADCLPIFIADKNKSIIGLIHAGWRGSDLGVTRNTVALIKKDFHVSPTDIITFIGPSIRSCCYEVGEEVAERFDSKHLIRNSNNHYYLDLVGVNLEQLKIAGLKNHNIRIDKRCTRCSKGILHSFRRDGKRAGRNVCFISHKGLTASTFRSLCL